MSQPGVRTGHGVAVRVVVAVAVVLLVIGYAVLAVLTRDRWLGGAPTADRTSVVFTATAPDGSATTEADVAGTRQVLEDRAHELGDTTVSIDGADTLTVTVAGADEADVRKLDAPGRMYLRPVIHSIPAQAGTAAPADRPTGTATSQVIQDEKALRQGTDQNVQILALQFQTSRCGQPDALAGHDDPTLPLVTCSQDGQTVYLLAPSILGNDEILSATSDFDKQYGQHVVDVEFTPDGADTWADFTARNVGTQTAFTVDTAVVSAPEIREAIPGGRTQITGQFTGDSARELAVVLGHGALPLNLTFESAGTTPGPPAQASKRWQAALAAGAVPLFLVVLGTAVYLRASRRRPATATERGPQ